eukprot:CAMPEP_0194281270 /NCGR_PEP_ID=MMETSP0169-20130528/20420_1 /TAXON_ID=218684 /ORGANISM="Corethron pennatum, Strain L29A3" /LENGTH=481 /DNA_ID=CAMNT_0039026285 /DNA_START=436 /DNA_END=1878 /DNA_ORIENTATION=+
MRNFYWTSVPCDRLAWLHFDEIQLILDSCPESCGVCGIPISSGSPTLLPTIEPTKAPITLTGLPSVIPSDIPSFVKSYDPSYAPSSIPTGIPINSPSNVPSNLPSVSSSIILSNVPSYVPSATPSVNSIPSYARASHNMKTAAPSSHKKTAAPSWSPSIGPSEDPSKIPSVVPVEIPSKTPSKDPSGNPTIIPSTSPSAFSTSISVEIPIDTKQVSVPVVQSSIKTLAPTNQVLPKLPKTTGSQILGEVEGRESNNYGNTIYNEDYGEGQTLFIENIMAGIIAGMSIALIALVSYTLNRGKVRKKMKSQESSSRKQKPRNNFEEEAQIEDSADSDENDQSELSDGQPEVKLESVDLKSGKRKERREKEQQKVQQNSVESSKLHVKQKKFRKESQSSSDEFKEDPKLLHESLEGSQLMNLAQDAEDRTIKSILKKRNPSSSDIDLLLTPNSYSSDSDFELVDGDRILSMISSSKENSNESFG